MTKFTVFHAMDREKVRQYDFDSYDHDNEGIPMSQKEGRNDMYDLSKENPTFFILVMKYQSVANVKTDTLDSVYELTNHIHSNWTTNDNVIALHGDQHRSTSIGDLIKDMSTKELFIVERCGFRKLGG